MEKVPFPVSAGMVLIFLLINNLIIIKLINIIIRSVNFHQDSSAKDSWIGAYSIGLTFMGKLGCSRKKKKIIIWIGMPYSKTDKWPVP